MNPNLKAPFPYFGGKKLIASRVWQLLGDPKRYIEPFFGSGAVLLSRPETKHDKIYEIVNDKDGFISNVWRSIQLSPDETARWCDWPVNHADLNARRRALIANEARLIENLCADPEWHDAKFAGYWIYCASCWIGAGLTSPDARPKLAQDTGIHSKRPHLACDTGIHSKSNAHAWIAALAARLKNAKVVCGDWTRVCRGNWQARCAEYCGWFFDPPYATSGRDESLYHHDSMTVGKDVEAWCLPRGGDPKHRIVIAGYEDEYASLVEAGWRVESWIARGCYSGKDTQGAENRHRERLFISPHCAETAQKQISHSAQLPLMARGEGE